VAIVDGRGVVEPRFVLQMPFTTDICFVSDQREVPSVAASKISNSKVYLPSSGVPVVVVNFPLIGIYFSSVVWAKAMDDIKIAITRTGLDI